MALTLFENVTWDRIVDTCCTYIPEGGLDCGHSTYNMAITDICHEHHERRSCKFFLAGVNFYRFNAKIGIFFTDLTRKIGVFRCKFYSPKILPV